MATIRPFRGIRPDKQFVTDIASRPYDVLSSEEARAEAAGNEKSLYRIIKPEIDFPAGKDEHDADVYAKAAENFKLFQDKGWLVQDTRENYYVYAQTMDGRTQYGLVVGSYVPDYLTGAIKKHELTRKDKEEDRMKHVRVNNANIEPVFFAYPDNPELDIIVKAETRKTPEYDFVSADGIRHTFWIIDYTGVIDRITDLFADIPYLYIADGHHRSAAAALVGAEKAKQNPDHTGKEEYNYFMAVCFPANQLKIMDYNRLVKDLNGLSNADFLTELAKNFTVTDKGEKIYHPAHLHNFALYLNNKHWYSLDAKPGTYNDSDPIGVLDVTISSNLILDKLLGMKDLRTDKRVDFVGGLRGLGELKKRVDSGEMAAALALYPVSMKQLIDIADSGNIMPPKTTWFEPKLRSGLVIHSLA
ncbi:DUF1015 domain-containing protein [Candidatus Symbiothrix dinenymphae]|uniref:DUF1015 domain-containing protein n=1 Tax=Candidatus Symbiothrix dinenymphae TaxID=467085 RepID=UPI0006C14E2D|nr:DUF1015 domain-containing protein [Candidatus Symbiothrix dinenymphae]GAP71233.1 hypothetical protein SAMD00024442_1_50 [Candidatus Symbiothrix dinenymphae]